MTFLQSTPGPWKVHHYHRFQVTRWPEEYVIIANAVDDNQQANARLIAAAPDLLEALKQMAVRHESTHDADCPGDDTCDCGERPLNDLVNSAIAKAEGYEIKTR